MTETVALRVIQCVLLEDRVRLGLSVQAAEELAQAIHPFVGRSLERTPVCDPEELPVRIRRVAGNYLRDGQRYVQLREAHIFWVEESARLKELACENKRWRLEESDAQDIADMAVEDGQRALRTFRFDGRLDGWLNKILENAFRQWCRERGGPVSIEEHWIEGLPAGDESDPVDAVLKKEQQARKQEAKRVVDQAIRSILRNRDLLRGFIMGAKVADSDLRNVDIARLLGVRENYVDLVWFRFKRSCRNFILDLEAADSGRDHGR